MKISILKKTPEPLYSIIHRYSINPDSYSVINISNIDDYNDMSVQWLTSDIISSIKDFTMFFHNECNIIKLHALICNNLDNKTKSTIFIIPSYDLNAYVKYQYNK